MLVDPRGQCAAVSVLRLLFVAVVLAFVWGVHRRDRGRIYYDGRKRYYMIRAMGLLLLLLTSFLLLVYMWVGRYLTPRE